MGGLHGILAEVPAVRAWVGMWKGIEDGLKELLDAFLEGAAFVLRGFL